MFRSRPASGLSSMSCARPRGFWGTFTRGGARRAVPPRSAPGCCVAARWALVPTRGRKRLEWRGDRAVRSLTATDARLRGAQECVFMPSCTPRRGNDKSARGRGDASNASVAAAPGSRDNQVLCPEGAQHGGPRRHAAHVARSLRDRVLAVAHACHYNPVRSPSAWCLARLAPPTRLAEAA